MQPLIMVITGANVILLNCNEMALAGAILLSARDTTPKQYLILLELCGMQVMFAVLARNNLENVGLKLILVQAYDIKIHNESLKSFSHVRNNL